MNIRHAATLIFVGCYLMAPPIRPGGGVDLRTPMSQWNHIADFDSAAACDEMRDGRIDLANKLTTQIQERVESLKKKLDSLSDEQANNVAPELNRRLDKIKPELIEAANGFASMRASQCIATDDPRLKAK